jgi:hypothetical protein
VFGYGELFAPLSLCFQTYGFGVQVIGFVGNFAVLTNNFTIMKKILFLLAMLPMMVFTACSSDDDMPEAQEIKKEITIYNNIDKNSINTNKYDGNLYDVYILTGDGVYPLIGDITNGMSKTFDYPKNANSDKFAVLLKLGKSQELAKRDNFTVLSTKANKEMLFFAAREGKPLEISISEDFYFLYLPYKNIKDVITAIEGNM